MMVQTLSLIWKQTSFHIQNPRQITIPKSQINQSSPRFFIIEIVKLGL